ncbi:hypothetical protein TrCOL_g3750 [Triparma columacea]|jgi:hypothetical protein|uniref:WW domain-containing protein n=1 Tax=Triparma columacea TaxID=722753 RepID=A0A9W7G792_9STRA|nr:hypothetical protein TrCOL_g3750 [Triparma columacea]
MEEPTEVLNGGWEKYQDPETGYDYWWNADTDESTYDRPVGFETVRGNPHSLLKREGQPLWGSRIRDGERGHPQQQEGGGRSKVREI